MSLSISELCQAAQERCEKALDVTGDDRRLYLHDAIVKLFAALDVYAEPRPVRREEVARLTSAGGRGA